MFSSIKEWFTGKLIKQFLGSTVRKVLLGIAVLIPANAPFLQPIADAITNNLDPMVAGITAAALAGISFIWGYIQKIRSEKEKE